MLRTEILLTSSRTLPELSNYVTLSQASVTSAFAFLAGKVLKMLRMSLQLSDLESVASW